MMQAVAESGACLSGASAIHLNIFGPNPVVRLGTKEQKDRMLPPLIKGEHKACFGVTEPDAGLDTSHLKLKAEKSGNKYIVNGMKIWTSTAQEANKILLIARTTPTEKTKRPIDGLSLFYTDLDRKFVEVREIPKMGRHAVDSGRRLEGHQVGGFKLGPAFGQRVLDGLVLADGAVEHDPLLRILGGALQGDPADADAFGGDQDPLRVQPVQQIVEALAFLADPVLLRHRQAVEEDLVRIDRVAAHLGNLSAT